MTYPELAAIDSTPDQDLGLTIAFKLADRTTAKTPGEFLLLQVIETLETYVQQYVTGVQQSRVADALARASDKEKQDVAAALKIDLTVDVPDDVAVKP